MTIQFSTSALKRDLRKAVMGVALFAGIASVAHGCKPAQEPTQLEQNYTNDIIACAATAGYPGAYDHASDMRCRDQVNCKYGVGPCR